MTLTGIMDYTRICLFMQLGVIQGEEESWISQMKPPIYNENGSQPKYPVRGDCLRKIQNSVRCSKLLGEVCNLKRGVLDM